jgi:rare lipoprotein A
VRRALPLAALLLLESACSFMPRGGGYYQDDGPDRRPRNVSGVPDAVPKQEPLSAKGNSPYVVFSRRYTPLRTAEGYRERGVASWYGKKFNGKRTSNGETYDMYAMSAAHKTLPLPSYVRVRNLRNGKSVIVRVNDRGPFLQNRLIDLSYAAASKLGIVATGTGLVEVEGVTADSPPLLRVAESPPTDNPRMYVQLGAFGKRENAERLRARLVQRHFTSARIYAESKDGSTLYRVRIGPLAGVEQTDEIIARAVKSGFPDAIIAID